MNAAIQEPFEKIIRENDRKIHFYLHKLNVHSQHPLYQEYYFEGQYALWKAWKTYQPEKGSFSTYLNYYIRNRLIDLLRKRSRQLHNDDILIKEETKLLHNYSQATKNQMSFPVNNSTGVHLNDPYLWEEVKSHLTDNQWKWVYYYIVLNLPLKIIAQQENTTLNAVKGWSRQARKKLQRVSRIREMLVE